MYWNLGGDFYLDKCEVMKTEDRGITIKVLSRIASNQPPDVNRTTNTFLTDYEKISTKEQVIGYLLEFKDIGKKSKGEGGLYWLPIVLKKTKWKLNEDTSRKIIREMWDESKTK